MNRLHRFWFVAGIVMPVILLVNATAAKAKAGALDTTFSRDGRVSTRIQKFSGAKDVAVQPDGRVVVAGFSTGGGNLHFALVRYTAHGGRDRTFGGDGKVSTDVRGGGGARAVAIQPDGKIVAAGHAVVGHHDRFAVVRYKPNGSLDRTFGQDGRVTTAIGANAEALGMVIQNDAKIVVVGTAGGAHQTFALARYKPSGRLDPTFGGDGTVRTRIGTAGEASDVVLGLGGTIAVAGSTRVNGDPRFAVARYRSTGALDRTFGGDGKVTTWFHGYDDEGTSLVALPDGRITVAGYCELTTDQRGFLFALVRYRRHGALDSSFGKGGKVTTTFGDTDANALALAQQTDGKVVAVGRSGSIGGPWRFALSRYHVNGNLDRTFGGDGRVVTGIASFSIAFGAAIHDGKIVAVGEAFVSQHHNRFVGARYHLT
jgi:uncharacterized delta-60 repeat protein